MTFAMGIRSVWGSGAARPRPGQRVPGGYRAPRQGRRPGPIGLRVRPNGGARGGGARGGAAPPQENLITSDTVRRVCWEPPAPATPATVSAAPSGRGARPWQVELVTPLLVKALSATA
ncbi:hypothetical protein [Streptomyces sp. NPDC004284]|uniref:hypothetical protein n=1 Tax=Streptomyces sp. NPDC004284 TaxID=3364695 RepID=UPI0036AEE14B